MCVTERQNPTQWFIGDVSCVVCELLHGDVSCVVCGLLHGDVSCVICGLSCDSLVQNRTCRVEHSEFVQNLNFGVDVVALEGNHPATICS